ncbi:hypothetical protein AGMMS49950_07860 [Endomicrobiia bacterium]|nr:hypothetical protein AGMMS49950_07860 [Endomicrobiia bacterium]
MINKKPACKDHGFLDRPVGRTITREVKTLGRKRKVIMKLKTILSAFVLFVFVLGSCKDCPDHMSRYAEKNARDVLADAEKVQNKAESVAMTDKNAAKYWRDAQNAWLELEKVANAKAEMAKAKVNEAEVRYGSKV